jgi:hypothetical protein
MQNKISKGRLIQRIKRKIIRKINYIIDGYTITFEEPDGCDEYGTKYWVECKNGFSGRSWDLEPVIESALRLYLKQILEEGIIYNNITYYLKDDIFAQITENWSSKMYYSKCKVDFNITLISDEEFKLVKENIANILDFVESTKEKIKNYDDSNKTQALETVARIKGNCQLPECSIIYNNYEYLKYLKDRPKYFNKFLDNIKKTPYTSTEVFEKGMNIPYLFKN